MSARSRLLAGLTVLATLALAPAASAAGPPRTVPLAPGSRPEGIANGPGPTYFAGSLGNGAIYRGNLLTGDRRVLVPGIAGHSIRGMQYDGEQRVLWVAGDEPASATTTRSTVLEYDAVTGALLRRVVVPGQRFLNDVQITDRAVYVTDSFSTELVVVTDTGFSLLTMTGDYPAVAPGSFGPNGIRRLADNDLVVTDSATGGLFRIDRRTGRADRIELTGRRLTSGDGLALHDSTLYVVRGFGTNAIAVVQLAADGRSGRVVDALRDPDLDVPTTAILSGGALYAVNARFGTPPTPTTPYQIVRVALP